jgi:hypothetical protein
MNNPRQIVMVRPARFGFNEETAASNSFQNYLTNNNNKEAIFQKALQEFEDMIRTLQSKKIEVHVYQDSIEPLKPDAIFPNNWISSHPDGKTVIYPMEAKNRRTEIRTDIIELLQTKAKHQTIDYSSQVNFGRYLEGTGSIIFDHENRKAYCAESSRSDIKLFEGLCEILGFKALSFQSHDLNGKAIYHTNVMLSIGENVIVICSEAISDTMERAMVLSHLKATTKLLIDLNFNQMNNFACNCLEVNNKNNKPKLVMSTTAFNSLTDEQKALIQHKVELVAVHIPTIETIGGGSARCMMLGFY